MVNLSNKWRTLPGKFCLTLWRSLCSSGLSLVSIWLRWPDLISQVSPHTGQGRTLFGLVQACALCTVNCELCSVTCAVCIVGTMGCVPVLVPGLGKVTDQLISFLSSHKAMQINLIILDQFFQEGNFAMKCTEGVLNSELLLWNITNTNCVINLSALPAKKLIVY